MTSLSLLFLLTTAFAQDEPASTADEPAAGEPTPEEPAEPAPADASAANLERARELHENGRALFDEGAYEQAILAWQEAYDLTKRHALLYNIAGAAERMADYDRAIQALTTYRAFASEDEKDSLARRMRSLERQRDEAEAKASQPAAAPAPQPADVATAPEPAVKARKRGTGQRIAGGALLGVGAAGIGTGIALGVLSSSRKSAGAANCLESGLCLADARPDLEASRSLGLGADVALGAGIVTAGLGAVLLFTAPSGTVSMGPGSIHFRGTF